MGDSGKPEAVAALDARLQELRDAEGQLAAAVERVHIATRDMGQVVKDARQAVREMARDEVRRYLAKEAETVAQRIREDMRRVR